MPTTSRTRRTLPGLSMHAQMLAAGQFESVVERTPLSDIYGKGYSGATLERVTFGDGTTLIIKRISPEWDVSMRYTHDTGRAAQLWTSGVLDRLPTVIDHTLLAVEPESSGWIIVMRDVSAALLPDDRILARAESYRILAAAAALHETFRGKHIHGLCTVTDHLALFSPATTAGEPAGPASIFTQMRRGWELFGDIVPGDIVQAIFALHDQPHLLAEQLERRETTLIHGDLWLANVGLSLDHVVMLDWGLATAAPPALEFTSYLAGNWSRIAASREQLIDDFRAISGEYYDDQALRLAFIATLVEYGWNKAFDSVECPDEAVRVREAADLDWWVRHARKGLETWSPV